MNLSIIIPVYNVEKYLRKCVDSLLAQDYEVSEIILVDDGSTDSSSAICDEYERMYDNIHTIHQTNGGLSAARNTGIAVAKGEYVCFVDSDDYWEKNVLGGLMEQVEREELDVLRFDYQNVRVVDAKHLDAERLDSANLEYEVFDPNKYPHPFDKGGWIVDGVTYLNERMGYACYATQFIVKREIVPQFTEGIYFEDTEWTPRMLIRAKRVGSTPKIVYNYFWREGSITKTYSKAHIQKKAESLIKVNMSLQSLLPQVKDKRWINGCIADNVYALLNNVAAYDYEEVPSWIDRLKKDKMLPLHGYKIRKMTRLRYGMINMCPRIYCWMRNMRKKHQ